MSAAALLAEAERRGFRLSINGDKLHVKPVPDAALLERLRAHKGELLKALSGRARLQALAAEACQGLSGYIIPERLLAKLAPEDISYIEAEADPLPFLRSFAVALVWGEFRRQGMAPPGWDKAAHCDRCGSVYLWRSMHVAGCPWCWNRLHGVNIPRPDARERDDAPSKEPRCG